jgi:hypothetical protein
MDYHSWWLINYGHDFINEYKIERHLLGLRATPRKFWNRKADNRVCL